MNGKELKDAARKTSSAQKSEFHDTNVVTPGEGPAAQVGSGVGNEAAALAPQATALVPPSPIAQVDRRAALGSILTGGAAALIAPIIPGGNFNVGLPGSPTDGVFRKMMILSAPSGFPNDGSYTGLGWYQDGWSGIKLGEWVGGVLQWGAGGGGITFGAGAGSLSSVGMRIKADAINRYVAFVDGTDAQIATIWGTGTYVTTGTLNMLAGGVANGAILATAVGGASQAAYVLDAVAYALQMWSTDIDMRGDGINSNRIYGILDTTFTESTSPAAPASGNLRTYADASHNFRQISSLGQDDIFHHGDYAPHAVIATADAGLKTAYSRVIKGGSLGANGVIESVFDIVISNTGATGVSATVTVIIGGTTVFTITLGTTGTSTPRYSWANYKLRISNLGSASSQMCVLEYKDVLAKALSSTVGTAYSNNVGLMNSCAENFANDVTIYVKVQLSTATNSKSEWMGSEMLGPYYGG